MDMKPPLPLRFTRHALEKMYERGISPADCERVAREGEVAESYEDDRPFPSELRVGTVGDRALHVVVARGGDALHVITAYEPDPGRWDETLKKRRRDRR
jgi:hypothetical protein